MTEQTEYLRALRDAVKAAIRELEMIGLGAWHEGSEAWQRYEAALDAYAEGKALVAVAEQPCYRNSCFAFQHERLAADGPLPTIGLCAPCASRVELQAKIAAWQARQDAVSAT